MGTSFSKSNNMDERVLKPLQTVSRFPRETRRGTAAPKSKTFTLRRGPNAVKGMSKIPRSDHGVCDWFLLMGCTQNRCNLVKLDENWCLTLWLAFDNLNVLAISTGLLPDVALSLTFTHNQFSLHYLTELRQWTNFAPANEHVIFKLIHLDDSKQPGSQGEPGKRV